MDKPSGYARFEQLIKQPEPYTDDDLKELRQLINMVSYTQNFLQAVPIMRASIEILEAIRQFDKASANLIKTTNRLTERIIHLTWVMLTVGILGAIASGWHPLTWWISHGFHFR